MDEEGRQEARRQNVVARSVQKVFDEVGIVHLWQASFDVHLLIVMRFVRLLAFGQASLILVLFFKSLGINERQTGIFMAATLVGDVVISFVLTLYADRLGRRATLLWGAGMMAVAGTVFAVSSNYYVLLAAAVIGVISPSGGEIGPFRAIEESALAHLVTFESRADIFAWYTLLSSFGAALGSMSGGSLVQISERHFGYSDQDAYRMVFWSYTVLGVVKCISTVLLSKDIELESEPAQRATPDSRPTETQPLLAGQQRQESAEVSQSAKKRRGLMSRLMPHLSPESRRIVALLSLLFALDSFGSSMSTISWITYYISRKFHVSGGVLGSIFFTSGVISSLATLGGSSISKRLGPLVTMVVTHLPASIMLALIPLPQTLAPTLGLLWVRSSMSTMDVVPRQVFLSAVVLKNERTAVMGWVNVVKTCAQVFGPTVTGHFTEVNQQWISFVAAGTLKAIYDLSILFTFLTVKLDRDRE
jgi:MFS family permease